MPEDIQQPNVYKFPLGPLQTNAYALVLPDKRAYIIDPGMDPEPLIEVAEKKAWNIQAIWLTHAHYDHIGGIHALRQACAKDCPIYIHPIEENYLLEPEKNRSLYFGMPMAAPAATHLFEEGDTLYAGPHEVRILHTPGHSPGSVSLYVPDIGLVFAGDALFQQSIGRSDFPDGDHNTLIEAIKHKLLTLPDNTQVLPGHGPETMIGHEKQHNPHLR